MTETVTPGEALRRRGLRPRKRLGQNFLRDRRFLLRILDAAEVTEGDRVLEVGAGTGILTRALLDRGAHVLAVELDDSLVALVREELGGCQALEIWHGDVLGFDPCSAIVGPYKLVGNIPYYVTGAIVRRFLESPCPPSVMVLMVQREVAERMVAAPGDLSLLGVSVQFYTHPEIVSRVPAGAFQPRPKVDSAIVRLTPHPTTVSLDLRDEFFKVARAGFGTRRKTIANALRIGLGITREQARLLLDAAGIDERRRAETLSLDEWGELAVAFHRQEREL